MKVRDVTAKIRQFYSGETRLRQAENIFSDFLKFGDFNFTQKKVNIFICYDIKCPSIADIV
jgi:hypothetical protein